MNDRADSPADGTPDGGGSTVTTFMQLFRLPNVFTAIADVAMGYLFVHGSPEPTATFAALVGASCLLYTAGMVLNDVFDFEIDSHRRPDRPLPSGRIPLGTARRLGFSMLGLGVALGWTAGFVPPTVGELAWRSGAVATLLALCVVLYDGVLKRTPFAPWLMGACRTLNVLLGMSLASRVAENRPWTAGFDPVELLIAGGIGLFVVGITYLARDEAVAAESGERPAGTPGGAIVGGLLMTGGVAMLAAFPFVPGGRVHLLLRVPDVWPLLLVLLSFNLLRRIFTSAPAATPRLVKQAIVTIIVLDAAVALATAGPIWGMAVISLLIPTLILGRWVYST